MGEMSTSIQDAWKHAAAERQRPRHAATGDGVPGHPDAGGAGRRSDPDDAGAGERRQAAAARLLEIGKTTLYRKLKEYGIDEAPEF